MHRSRTVLPALLIGLMILLTGYDCYLMTATSIPSKNSPPARMQNQVGGIFPVREA